ncbi:hypothetical protein EVAR_86934_1 [Eumeta japonica]|uniref:Reverse transcriptase/retrotransposon-derived protein RNase H-like domain-containing protein n=1 Tax=Eumeta variegata TaxID=151549 RepID=A0A4C1W829_EUMVA|nr:hypothetical protein EVAR_86934_1 [Eumeta japonica]
MSVTLYPLHELLLKKEDKWKWNGVHQKAFEQIKQADRVLAHYDPEAEMIFSVDTGPSGLGAVWLRGRPQERSVRIEGAHRGRRGVFKNTEGGDGYYFWNKKKEFFYGRAQPLLFSTDHKPLISIFGNKKGILEKTANRLQQYALFLLAYDYKIEYVRSTENTADYLSCSGAPPAAPPEACAERAQHMEDACIEQVDANTYLHFLSNTFSPKCKRRNSTRFNFKSNTNIYRKKMARKSF